MELVELHITGQPEPKIMYMRIVCLASYVDLAFFTLH